MTETTATGMTAIVSQLTTGITPATIFAVVGDIMPFVVSMVPIALALTILRRMVKGSSKGKVRF